MSLTIIDNNNIFQKDVIGNVRMAQEDSHDIAALTPNGDIFVVCDGMGGHVGGKQASTIAVKSIIEYLKKERYPEPQQALNEALQFANMQILGYANEHPELKGMGTTACIVLLQESEAYIAHVGDSRIYLYLGKEKQLHRITKDHSFVQTLVDAGQITDEEAEHHPNKNVILKALGIKPDLVPSFGSVKPKNGDVFLICSDGLSGMISDATMREVLMKQANLEEKGETLINLALEAGGLDNITLELIQIANSPHLKSVLNMNYNPTVNCKSPNRRSKVVKKLIITLVSLLVCLAIGCGLYTITSKMQSQQQRDSINDQITELKARIESLGSEIQKQTTEYNKLIESVNEATKDRAEYPNNQGYERDYQKHKKEADSLRRIIETLKTEKKEDSIKLVSLNDSLKILTQKPSK